MRTKRENARGPLSAREAEVLELIRAGMSRRTIAGRLRVSVPYVREVTRRIRDKLGAVTIEDLR